MSNETPLPKRLYKYQPPSVQALTSLSAGKLWFSTPSKFNDPFDCALEASLATLSDQDCNAITRRLFPNMNIENPHVLNTVRQQLSETIPQLVLEARNKVRGVCCFTEIVDDLLMWGHYADSHRGFCLEFDTTLEPITKAKPVNYSYSFPNLDIGKIANGEHEQVLDLVLTKAACWQYEKEWRVLHEEGDKIFGYERKALTGVFFGARMPQEQRLMVASFLSKTTTELYNMRLNKSHFKLEAEPLRFTPIDYHPQ
jgi:hypothetical protein